MRLSCGVLRFKRTIVLAPLVFCFPLSDIFLAAFQLRRFTGLAPEDQKRALQYFEVDAQYLALLELTKSCAADARLFC